ncbi:MAG: hypothetical protein HRT44_09005, partial [Bdellovibrionales bacterium]|nr:hypothetical protein [Bdellovibrionales bacterium]NQZ19378.1 hypothetical protein [Bdellovibrionales bacterium]
MKKWAIPFLFLSVIIMTFSLVRKSATELSRSLANTSRDKTDEQILVFRKNVRPYLIAAPSENRFDVRSIQSGLELAKLRDYLLLARQSFGISNDSEDFQLVVENVRSKGRGRVFVSFSQIQQRSIGNTTYNIPVSGGSIVVTLKDLRVDQVNTSLKSIRKRDFDFQSNGFDLSEISEIEFLTLNEQIRSSNDKAVIENFFNEVLRRAGLGENFDIDQYLALSTGEQRTALESLFSSMSRIATFRLLINLAQAERLSLVQYGRREWMYTIHQLFDLDIEFDILIPTGSSQQLKVKNLRTTSYNSDVHLHHSPFYPIELGEVIIKTNESGELVAHPSQIPKEIDWITARNFKSLDDYYREKYSWDGLTDSEEKKVPITIHSEIEGRYRGSARWSASKEVFLMGANGLGWVDKGKSVSIVGHEYFH